MSRRKKIPAVLTKDEQEAILKQPNPRYPTGQRNFTMLKVMLNIGLRVEETISLRWNHIDLMSGQVKVVEGKGAKDRILWLNDETLDEVRGWKQRQAEDVQGDCEHVFTTLKGKPLQASYMRAMMSRITDKAGIEKNVSPHTLRHTFATDLYRETKNIRLVQKALGHADLSTTMIYTHIVDDELEDALKNFRIAKVS